MAGGHCGLEVESGRISFSNSPHLRRLPSFPNTVWSPWASEFETPSLMELQRVFGSPNILKPLSPIRKMSYPHHPSLEGN